MSMSVSSPVESSTLPSAPFDGVAESYDETFTDTGLGRWLRDLVWAQLESPPEPGSRALELGCGTGEDAAWLADRGWQVTATDASPRMLDVASAKLQARGLSERARFVRWDLGEDVPEGVDDGEYALVFSNFGALNCAPDRPALWASLTRLLRPGGRLVVVFMGPFCPLETLGFGLRGEWRSAVRRWRDDRPATIGEHTVQVWFPSVGKVRRELAKDFASMQAVGIGSLVPPSHWSAFVARHPRLFALARRLDGLVAPNLGPWIADHYLLSCRRRETMQREAEA